MRWTQWRTRDFTEKTLLRIGGQQTNTPRKDASSEIRSTCILPSRHSRGNQLSPSMHPHCRSCVRRCNEACLALVCLRVSTQQTLARFLHLPLVTGDWLHRLPGRHEFRNRMTNTIHIVNYIDSISLIKCIRDNDCWPLTPLDSPDSFDWYTFCGELLLLMIVFAFDFVSYFLDSVQGAHTLDPAKCPIRSSFWGKSCPSMQGSMHASMSN